MDKILANKFLGLKVEDILKCVLLVGVGYCIAVMLGNFNCVEGLYQCSTGKTTCSMEEYDGGRCPGWELADGVPFISNFDEVLSCPDDDSSVDKGYQTREACLVQLSELRGDYTTSAQRGWVRSIDACPNPTPTVPATPATPVTPGTQAKAWVCSPIEGGGRACDEWTVGPKNFPPGPNFPTEEKCKAECTPARPPPTPPAPAPPAPPTSCTYTGDRRVNNTTTPKFKALNPEWWAGADVGDSSCSQEIANCRSDMVNWHTEYGGNYAGFCLQTIGDKDGNGRGSCGRQNVIMRNGQPGVISDRGTIGTDPTNAAALCADTSTNKNAGNFAWVADTATSGDDACDPGCPKIPGRDGSGIRTAYQAETFLEGEFDISA